MDDSDLVTILGNLLDNAVTAAEQSNQKKVSLETAVRNLYDVIVITNTCHQPPVSSGNLLITTKEEKRLHGIGLHSVAKALKKYGGDFDWEYDANQQIFATTVMLKPNIQESEK